MSAETELAGPDFDDRMRSHRRAQGTAGGPPTSGAGRVFAAVAFVDIARSTEIVTRLGDRAWRDLLDAFHVTVHRSITSAGGQLVNTLGDGAFAAFPTTTAAVRWSETMHQEARELDLVVRIGIHASEVERRGRDLAGIGIHVAARVASVAPLGRTIVTSTVRDLLDGSMIELADRGDHDLLGIERRWRLFAVLATDGAEDERHPTDSHRGGLGATPRRRLEPQTVDSKGRGRGERTGRPDVAPLVYLSVSPTLELLSTVSNQR